ncbi:hypothetical protein ENUP19_0252G0087 [Entamoeba nuttalli]|uniref:DNA replication complex GINS protein PSF1 n=2 Tax=Entamoeba nuttalli TaxID=412467 RepID=K2HT95_ENTNP|nr:DNA replication complex GINS protein PSF1, putative [Entamoeba nuttalli P19]EKE39355.1 DNA replication complex GINS protein PSF1, putative [Entamoeba nuttalli P19]|eukprot:XP_008858310.1 DNA replication complex GINS protein PSF1, putative [Entamoeba nuttalli P19]
MASIIHEKLVEAIKELDRSGNTLPPPNKELIEQIKEELTGFKESQILNPRMVYANALRQRLKDLYEIYLSERLKRIENIRWEIGTALPVNIRASMTNDEIQYFKQYCKIVGEYSVNSEVDVVSDTLYPPINNYINVRANVTKGMDDLPQNPSIYTTNGLLKLDNSEVQCVLRNSTVDSLIHLGVLSIVD